jgi:hypothetical protein
MFLVVAVVAMITGATGLAEKAPWMAYILGLIPIAGLGYWAWRQLANGVDFVSGLAVGLTAGLLGGTALCLGMLGALSGGR